MRVVGVRELKNRLSEYLRQVEDGETILVTNRGEVVAELREPLELPADRRLPAGLRDLIQHDLASAAAPNDPEAYPDLPPLLGPGEAGRLLDRGRS